MAKTNPFIKGLSPAELAKLRRKAPYVDQVYNPETNEVNYDIILSRLNDTTKKVSDVEQIFLNQVKRNLQREYWANSMQKKDITKTDETFSTDKDSVKNPQAGFSNYTQGEVGRYSTNVPTANQFFPEEFSRYVKGLGGYIQGKYYHPDRYGYAILPIDPQDSHYRAEKYYMERMFADQPDKTTGDPAWRKAYFAEKEKNPSLTRPVFIEKYNKEKVLPAVIGNLTRAEKIFNSITSGVENVNRVYADRKEQERIEKEQALNRAIKAEAAVASYQRKEKFDREQFDRALADKDKAYNERFEQANAEFKKLIDARDTAYKAETAKRTVEFDNWRKTFESSSIEQAKQQAEQHTREMSQLRAESVRQAQDLANAKVENERIKSQNAILLKNNTRRRIALKQMGNIGLSFVGAAQRDSQSTALLSVLAGKNRYVPATRRVNEYGRLVESRGDTAVPDTFLSLISPQPQNRSKK